MTAMNDRAILTPYFLDEYLPGLAVLAQSKWTINTPRLDAVGTQARMVQVYEPLAEAVATAVRAGERPVSIAGDCCATLGMVAGLQRGGLNPSLLWFDAHGDFNTWETTPSGFLGGMPLAMLVGRGELAMAQALGLRPLPELAVWLSDARDLDLLEREALLASRVNLLPVVTNLTAALNPAGPLYVHFDVDVLRPRDMPAVKYPAQGGPSAEILGRVFQALAATRRVAAVSLSAWDPEMDKDGASRKLAMKLLQYLLA